MNGVDISSGSGIVNFETLKSNGFEFVIVRAGWGSSVKQTDERFDVYVSGALDAGLHVGAYWFIYARTVDEAEENARCFLQVVDRWRGKLDMPLYIDYEYDSTRYYEQETGLKERRDTATEYIRRSAEIVEADGYYSGVYLNPDYIRNHVNYDELKQFTLWLAQWGVSEPSYKCDMWQTTGDTHIIGVSGGVDLNECFTDFPTVIRRKGLNGFDVDVAPQASGMNGDKWEIVNDGYGLTIKLGRK